MRKTWSEYFDYFGFFTEKKDKSLNFYYKFIFIHSLHFIAYLYQPF